MMAMISCSARRKVHARQVHPRRKSVKSRRALVDAIISLKNNDTVAGICAVALFFGSIYIPAFLVYLGVIYV